MYVFLTLFAAVVALIVGGFEAMISTIVVMTFIGFVLFVGMAWFVSRGTKNTKK